MNRQGCVQFSIKVFWNFPSRQAGEGKAEELERSWLKDSTGKEKVQMHRKEASQVRGPPLSSRVHCTPTTLSYSQNSPIFTVWPMLTRDRLPSPSRHKIPLLGRTHVLPIPKLRHSMQGKCAKQNGAVRCRRKTNILPQ